jgi:hypothetical protein
VLEWAKAGREPENGGQKLRKDADLVDLVEAAE